MRTEVRGAPAISRISGTGGRLADVTNDLCDKKACLVSCFGSFRTILDVFRSS